MTLTTQFRKSNRTRRLRMHEGLEPRTMLTTTTVEVVADGELTDLTTDGVFDTVETGTSTFELVEGLVGEQTRRGVLEFAIDYLDGALVTSATLEFTPRNTTALSDLVTYGAAGNGTVELADADIVAAANEIDRLDTNSTPIAPSELYAIDVTDLINDLSAADSTHAAFALTGDDPLGAWSIAAQNQSFFLKPQLTVTYNIRPEIDDASFNVTENSPSGTAVGTVTGTDAEPGDSLTYAIVNGNVNSAFAIDGAGNITVDNAAAIDFEQSQVFALQVEVTDTAGQTAASTVTIQVDNDPTDDVTTIDPVQASIELSNDVWDLVRSGDLTFRQGRRLATLSYSAAFWSFIGFEAQAERRLDLFIRRVDLLVNSNALDAATGATLIGSAQSIIDAL